jgi:hypothetical protein
VLSASNGSGDDMGFYGYQSFNYYVFDAVHDRLEVNPNLFEVLG